MSEKIFFLIYIFIQAQSLHIHTDSHKIIFNKDELSILYKQGIQYYKECKNMVIDDDIIIAATFMGQTLYMHITIRLSPITEILLVSKF